MSKLLPLSIIKNIPKLYETENQEEKICYVKLFLADSNWTWYIIEIDKQDNNTCFGLVDGFEQELGYFTIKELENLKGLFVHTPEQFGQPADLHPDTLPELIRTASRFIFGQF
ncbi:DUF2958 domain-containing protein [Aliarcobacter butzleri]|uniref:DUF2958 domain-containing protein n=1 Tax=Aliarcobacter butzleri TaxID=28197 RepID=UPI0021B4CFD2|nr:DUF2958 domain-containing protein [Aliarcobacter butzleri]MCT7573120.1 DUF2958 domain-containing protein [Aliarcobacter butzleri]